MTLIKSISGIRGTIGGTQGTSLTPIDIVKFSAAFCRFLQESQKKENISIMIGRDARISGDMVNKILTGTLLGMGANVIETGLSTTPTVEMAVVSEKADGGIILTASHNPAQWNALKLLNHKGEFINEAEGAKVLELSEDANLNFATIDKLGNYREVKDSIEQHIKSILALDLVDVEAIRQAKFKIAVDCVNSVGALAIPPLFEALQVEKAFYLNETPNGIFAHNPEPLPENLTALSETVVREQCHLGFAVDPDVDRLAIVCEDGEMFGEEYTLVAVSDYVLSKKPGNTVSNMSSTRALRNVTEKYGQSYTSSAVGEVNVVEAMKKTNAIVGGEGNGGIILPELHYGRDALVGIALFLSHLAKKKMICSQLRTEYPNYYISKNKIELTPKTNIDKIFAEIKTKYSDYKINTIDGVKIEFDTEWVHLRKSNTEPIIRIYAESDSLPKANNLASKIMNDIAFIAKSK